MRVLNLLTMTATIAISSTTTQALPTAFDAYREEIKSMADQGHHRINYSRARKHLLQEMHIKSDDRGYYVKDVYCHKMFRKRISPSTMPSANEINIEHTWPKSRFGSRKGSSKYSDQKSDMHHLFPTDSRTNSIRANHYFTQFPNNESGLDGCATSKLGYVASEGFTAFEPPEEHKGNVARALFYFAVKYDMRISAHEEFILRQWNLIDPVDQEEIDRNTAIEQIQGNRNPFVDDSDLAHLIEDF